MLDEYREIHAQCADRITGWRSMEKNELCRQYIVHENDGPYIREAYLSAIICKYWKHVGTYSARYSAFLKPEDCYDILLDSILYVLEHRQWENPESKLFGDINGPDKAINSAMCSGAINVYQEKNRDCRKLNQSASSIEYLQEAAGDAWVDEPEERLETPYKTTLIYELVTSNFRKKEYLVSFVLDSIAYEPLFTRTTDQDTSYTEFSFRKLLATLRNLDSTDAKIFSERYSVKPQEAENAIHYITSLPIDTLRSRCERCLGNLRQYKEYLTY